MAECKYHCRLFNLETPTGRKEYADLMTEIINKKYTLLVNENILKRIEAATPDSRDVEIQLWKLIEYRIDVQTPNKRSMKFTYEESLK